MKSAALKTLMVLLVAQLLGPGPVVADDPVFPPDAILGIWETAHEDGTWSRVEIFELDGTVHGQIVWLKNPVYDVGEVIGLDGQPRVDLENPDEDLRDRPLLGLTIMSDFTHNGANKWEGGTIYDPASGKTYRCKATLKDADTLEIFGYQRIGFVNLGKNTIWTRVTEPE